MVSYNEPELLRSHLWEQAPSQEHWEGLPARVGFPGLQDLTSIVLQEAMQAVGAPVTK